MTARNIAVTSALPYANGPIHIGHLVEYIQTDIWVRYQKLVGNDCRYYCADDAHGTPIMLRARDEGIEPRQLIDKMSVDHQADFADFLIEFESYHSTHSEENRECATRIYERLRDGGHLTKRTIEQAYDAEAKMFLPDRFIHGGCPRCKAADQYGDSCENCGATYSPSDLIDPVSVISGQPPIRKESEHLFFKLGDFNDMLLDWTADKHLQDGVRNKLSEWFDAGLRDWDISRDAPYWGFEIPDMPGKYFYVWLDAPIGYQASHLKYCREEGLDFDELWKIDSDIELYHFIGKDIAYFHTLFWPAMLHGAGYRTPTAVFCHGFLTVDGRKMSKSRGTFIMARTFLDHLEPEYLRYYYAAKLGSGIDDIDLSLDDFVYRVNSDLVGKVVNIASRCAGILNKQYESQLADQLEDDVLYNEVAQARHIIGELFEARDYAKALRSITSLADRTNRYIDGKKPWALVKNEDTFEEGRRVCTQGLNLYRVLITCLSPVVPKLAGQSQALLKTPLDWHQLDQPLLGATIEPFKALMYRIDKKKVQKMVDASKAAEKKQPAKKGPAIPEIVFDDFAKVDLRVAKIVAAEPVKGADKLLQLTVDLGDEQRNVFAGIKSSYSPESLVGRLTVVVANLQPRKMRFGVSEGMVLAAGGKDGIFLLGVDEGAKPGMKVS
ncbi:MAG: methionine--tRNA ligase [Proteobacteria bacterium]|nr:methionine--tRNA ligase [Pseudomonadota bacterium]